MSGFDLASYRDLLTALLERGYAARDYGDVEPQERGVILRHDLDMSLQAAVPLAEIEHSLGLKAHYFVLLRTEMYNPFSAAAREVLERLIVLGHEIGLHLDASLYGNDLSKLQGAAEIECGVLEVAVAKPIRAISFHRPAKTLLGYAERLAGRLHAYQPRFYSELGYCSDSRGAWHHGHPLDHPALREGRALQLLTHPIWWTGDASTPRAKLTAFLEDRLGMLDLALAENCTVHRPGTIRQPSDVAE